MDKAVFRLFKSFLTIIARMTEMTAVQYMQQRCIEYLAENKEHEAQKWFTTYWTGDRGTWTRAHSGPGCANTNNAQESGWGRKRSVIPRHYRYAEYMSTMLKYISDSAKDHHDKLLSEYDSIDFPEHPRLTREVWKKTCSISIADMRKWVVYEGDQDVWNSGIDELEAVMKQHGADSPARAGLMFKKEYSKPVLEDADLVHLLFPTPEMIDLFDSGFDSMHPGYQGAAGKFSSPIHLFCVTGI